MASAFKHHRRSHSASSSPIPRRSPGDSWRVATKRAHPQPFGAASPDPSSPHKWDVDSWRRGKRRRRNDHNVSDDSDAMEVDLGRPSFHSSPIPAAPATLPTPAFAATSADFHLFPKNNNRKRHATHHAEPTFDSELNADALTRLRSDAFWKLRRSVETNGEGFVKSMRVYESSRATAVSPKMKEAQPRGRRRSPFHAPVSGNGNDSDDEDDDDVQIFAGEPSNSIFLPRSQQRACSVGVVNEQPHLSAFDRGARSSSPGATCDSNSSIYLSDDDCFLIPTPPPNPQLSPMLSTSTSYSANSSESLSSLNLAPPLASRPILPSSRSEKAIAALTLAMANGAAGLEDYEDLQRLHADVEAWEAGEMWH